MKSSWKRNSIIYVVILLAAILLFSFMMPGTKGPAEVPLSQVITMSQNKEISKIEINPDTMTVITTDGKELTTAIGSLTIVDLKDLGLALPEGGYDIKTSTGINWGGLLINFLPLLIFGFLLFFLFRQARGANNQAMSFGRSRARLFPANRATVTFADVAGVEEAKQDMQEVVDFLKAREKFQSLGARIPKGVLLIGPPGTGKTLMARAVAGEADVPFFSISGSEFVEMFVGVGASRVRDLFDQAKRNTPCIIFIDEIDAVGRQRGAGLGGSHDEREQTLNQILVEMDGFDTNVSVIVIAATNRPDILDPALLRPGRFDRRVILDLPDIVGRLAVLKVHTNGKPLDRTVNLETLAKGTVGFSGADLANVVNEAAILAARRDKKAIGMEEFDESVDRVMAGPERKSRKISPKEKEVIAYHEAGHALVAKMLPNADPVHKISIVARGMALGYTKQLPTEDRYLTTRSQLKDTLATLLGGHAAEELIFNERSTGPHNDIQRVTNYARRMVTDYGMSDKLGTRTFGNKQEMVFLGREIAEQKDYSERFALEIDREINRIIDEAYATAKRILSENKGKLKSLAEKLIQLETLEGEELEKVFRTIGVRGTRKRIKETEIPVPVKPVGETEPVAQPKKAPGVPQLVPKQTPAPTD
ncbi:MAG: cell division protein FtsH [Chloroflexi bacterium RBG_16_58_8]|nr:MAG: cell division protein FtsH [Chloroflexi bacterium RBG_16_58_8]